VFDSNRARDCDKFLQRFLRDRREETARDKRDQTGYGKQMETRREKQIPQHRPRAAIRAQRNRYVGERQGDY
jgi:hypothetical protein